MFVLQWKGDKPLGRYIRRNIEDSPTAAQDTYTTVCSVDEATKFQSFEDVMSWVAYRFSKGYQPFPGNVQLVEVRSVIPRPQFEVVKVIG